LTTLIPQNTAGDGLRDFARWSQRGVVTYIPDQLRHRLRTDLRRCARPLALIVGSQSDKGASRSIPTPT